MAGSGPLTPLLKYPRTQHLEGSRLQPGDEDLEQVHLGDLEGRHLVVEEKVDGANSAISFDGNGSLLLQSRGHYLMGGFRERHFNLLKQWAGVHAQPFYAVLGSRYVMYGEWVYAKHTIFYDSLPHYFLEFDVFDRVAGDFLSTPRRRDLLRGVPVFSVPVIGSGRFFRIDELSQLAGVSAYKTPEWRVRLCEQCEKLGLDSIRVLRETDDSGEMEGIYVKWEEDGRVLGRYKWVRASFLTAVADSESHWQSRPIVPNLLSHGVDLFA
ncbi:MAG: DNA ligase [Acidobacteria bacterium]|nr:DNA ligase [Acidobacteriota bacterium]